MTHITLKERWRNSEKAQTVFSLARGLAKTSRNVLGGCGNRQKKGRHSLVHQKKQGGRVVIPNLVLSWKCGTTTPQKPSIQLTP